MNIVRWLDHSADANAIALMLNDSYSFYGLYSALEQTNNDNITMLFDLVREVWDAAYSHGYHDANAENGLTLKEMED